MKRWLVTGLIITLVVLALSQAALAAENDNYHGHWKRTLFADCSSPDNTFQVYYEAHVLPGSWRAVSSLYSNWFLYPQGATEWASMEFLPNGDFSSGEMSFTVPYSRDGSTQWMVYDVSIMDGDYTQLSYSIIRAECPSGEITIINEGVPEVAGPPAGALPPPPESRTQLTLVADTAFYAEPNPATILEDFQLEAGQTWFVVAVVEGTDGNMWFEVFTGGPNNAYVPAAAFGMMGNEIGGTQGDRYEIGGTQGDRYEIGGTQGDRYDD
ncbi:MAG: hypothetical protein GYB65_15865 [Chloroflexi bacterium]|nr:hypothetical protein [Chloroflexota bacterium]